MTKYFGFILILFITLGGKSQISINNSSFEGRIIPCQSVCVITGGDSLVRCNVKCPVDSFYFCDTFLDNIISGIPMAAMNMPNKSVSGVAYLALTGGGGRNLYGSIGTKLSCGLKANHKYTVSIWAATPYWIDTTTQEIFTWPSGRLCLWGNMDSCSRSQELYGSEYLDTTWTKLNAILSPTQDYEYFQIRPGKSINVPFNGTHFTGTVVDALSDIYPLDAGMVRAMAKDTVVGAGKCLSLRATPQISTSDTVLWYRYLDSTLLPIGMGWSVPVCPDTHSTYIVAMRDSVPDCAGIWWSYDTVRVWIDTTIDTRIAEAPRTRLGISLYPNPTQRTVQIEMLLDRSYVRDIATLTLYDMLGRAVHSTSFYNEQEITLPSLPEGIYTAEVRLDTHYWRGKLWVVE